MYNIRLVRDTESSDTGFSNDLDLVGEVVNEFIFCGSSMLGVIRIESHRQDECEAASNDLHLADNCGF